MLYPKEIDTLKTPAYVTDMAKIRANVAVLDQVQKRTGAKILLALKAYAQCSTFSDISRAFNGSLYGCCASSPYEARLAREDFQGEVHAFAAAFSRDDVDEILPLCDHIVFNSFNQLEEFTPLVLEYNAKHGKNIEIGIRINPEHSEGTHALYDPCSKISRLGVRIKDFRPDLLTHVSGLHFHTLCEQNADALYNTLKAVELHFGEYLHGMKWINFGGGHHITRSDYDIDLLCTCIKNMQEKYQLEVYLEPGEAIALNAGYFVASVLDIVEADIPTAILDCSAACHMPDVLEVPYTPFVFGAEIHKDMMPFKENMYRLAGKSCLAGDSIGVYIFPEKLQKSTKIVFKDMAIYTMVKNNTFNGIALPSIVRYDEGQCMVDKEFNYEDFKRRL